MKKLMIYCILWAFFVCPWVVFAGPPSCGISAMSDISPEGNKDSTKNLQLAVAITEELGQNDVPLSFFSSTQVSKSTKGKVTHQVSIYRGEEQIWTKKRTVKLERLDFTSDSWNTFCDAYKKGLRPGDIVVFDFGLKGHSIPAGGVELRVQLGPREMWSTNTYPWDSGFFECP